MKAKLQLFTYWGLILIFSSTCAFSQNKSERKLIWQDEFDYTGKPNPEKWSYDIGGHGWGNQEKQFYTNESSNSFVENGILKITAKKESKENNTFTSARLVGKGKADFLYGRFEIRAKLPKGIGTWPAIWMLASEQTYGKDFWPDNGEIDIMEHVGFDPNRIHGNVHTKAYNHSIGTNKGNNLLVEQVSDKFHVYTCDWTPSTITIGVDGKDYFTFQKENGWEKWPFDKKFHLILNIAVGGGWGGQKGIDETIFPQTMEIDYVRVFESGK